jgi:hypothetical protein
LGHLMKLGGAGVAGGEPWFSLTYVTIAYLLVPLRLTSVAAMTSSASVNLLGATGTQPESAPHSVHSAQTSEDDIPSDPIQMRARKNSEAAANGQSGYRKREDDPLTASS